MSTLGTAHFLLKGIPVAAETPLHVPHLLHRLGIAGEHLSPAGALKAPHWGEENGVKKGRRRPLVHFWKETATTGTLLEVQVYFRICTGILLEVQVYFRICTSGGSTPFMPVGPLGSTPPPRCTSSWPEICEGWKYMPGSTGVYFLIRSVFLPTTT